MQQWLVASRLPGDVGAQTYRLFVQAARRLSEQLSVRGALLFDGELAVQLIEGPARQVSDFMGEVYSGLSHQDIRVLAVCSDRLPALPPRWQAGYAEPQVLDPLCVAAAGDEVAARHIQGFLQVLATVDCQ